MTRGSQGDRPDLVDVSHIDQPASMLALSRLHFPVTVLGHGRRVGVWFQGCTLHCPGCISTDTWESGRDSRSVRVARVIEWIDRQVGVDGLTISGGEPLQQPAAVASLVAGFRKLPRVGDGDVLLYSGYSASVIRTRFPFVWDAVDVLVSGPFRTKLPGDALRGSSNQRIDLITDRARRRYDIRNLGEPKLQVSIAGGELWMIGLPGRGDIDHVQRRLEAQGIQLADVSWRS